MLLNSPNLTTTLVLHHTCVSQRPVITGCAVANFDPHRMYTPQPVTKKFVANDYVGDPYSCAKLGAYPSTGASGHMGEI